MLARENVQAQDKRSINRSNKTVQRMTMPTKPLLHRSSPMEIIQRISMNPDSLSHSEAMTLQRTIGNQALNKLLGEVGTQNESSRILQKKENYTGLPTNLKKGVENLSGFSMDDVRVHYNSDKPAQVGALAYTQGTNIHVAHGQEQHLPHEAWHVVQQVQGRVQPTMQLKGAAVNDNTKLESEADNMGNKAISSEKSLNHDIFAENTVPNKQLHESPILQFVRISGKSIKDKLEEKLKDKEWDSATGHSGSGKWSEKVTVRHKRSFEGERIPQILRHLSTVLFCYIKNKINPEEQEVQGMYVNDRLFFSNNDPINIMLTKEKLVEIFSSSEYIPPNEQRALRAMSKIKKVTERERNASGDEMDDFEKIREILINSISKDNVAELCELGSVTQYITDDKYKGKIIFVKGIKNAHAEQNLIIAYYKSGSNDKAIIYGKKRPCLGCYLTFMFAKEKLGKVNLRFNTRYGGYWQKPIKGLKELINIALEKGISITIDNVEEFFEEYIEKKSYRSQILSSEDAGDIRKDRGNTSKEETGYDTASDTDD